MGGATGPSCGFGFDVLPGWGTVSCVSYFGLGVLAKRHTGYPNASVLALEPLTRSVQSFAIIVLYLPRWKSFLKPCTPSKSQTDAVVHLNVLRPWTLLSAIASWLAMLPVTASNLVHVTKQLRASRFDSSSFFPLGLRELTTVPGDRKTCMKRKPAKREKEIFIDVYCEQIASLYIPVAISAITWCLFQHIKDSHFSKHDPS